MGLLPRTGTGRAAIFAALLLASCARQHGPGDRVVAEAYDEKLYWSDLRPVVPMDASPEDSAAIATRFLDNWARDRVMVHMANENLDDAQKDVERQIKSYRESLLTYAYEQALVLQNLDTAVSGSEVQDYYDKNIANFQLKDNIVRVRWFKLPGKDQKLVKKVERLWRSEEEEDIHKLEVLLAQHGTSIVDSHDSWIEFEELRQQVPLRAENPTDWLQHQSKVVVDDDNGVYFVNLIDHRLKDSTTPIDMVSGRIRSIIINQRKLKLVERLREDLYNHALATKDVRFP
jgi:hypothetical protein